MFSAVLFICLSFFRLLTAQYVVNETEGCVDITVTLPGPFTVLRVDKTDYEFDGEGACKKSWDEKDTIPCSLTEEGDGKYVATVHICDVEKHTWAGFRMDEYMQNQRYAFVTVYFSQGGAYSNIEENCIQPDESSPAEIDAAGKTEVEIICARHTECPAGPYSTIMTATADLCRDYGEPKCKEEESGGLRLLKTTFRKPSDEEQSYVFCSTLDSFLSYVINWA